MAEQIIFSINVETGKALPAIARLERGIKDVRDNQKALNKALKEGKITQDQWAKSAANNRVALKSLSAQMREATNSASGLTKAGLRFRDKMGKAFLNQLKGIGVATAAAFGTQQIIQFGKESVELAAKGEGIRRAFGQIPGSTALFEDLNEAARGTNSELELMSNAVKARNLGIPVQELAKAFEFARRRAAQTGESVQKLQNDIVIGLGRKSPKILDNLGISATRIKDALGGVSIEATSVEDFVKSLGSVFDEELANMGEDIDTTAVKMARLNATWENFSENVGVFLIGAGDSLLTWFDTLTSKSSTLSDQLEADFDVITLGLGEKFLGFIADSTGALDELNKVLKEQGRTEEEIAKIRQKAITSGKEGVFQFIAGEITLIDLIAELTVGLEDEIDALDESTDATDGNSGAKEKQLTIIQKLEAEIKELKRVRTEEADTEERVLELSAQIAVKQKELTRLTTVKTEKEKAHLGVLGRLEAQLKALNKEQSATEDKERIAAIELETAAIQKKIAALKGESEALNNLNKIREEQRNLEAEADINISNEQARAEERIKNQIDLEQGGFNARFKALQEFNKQSQFAEDSALGAREQRRDKEISDLKTDAEEKRQLLIEQGVKEEEINIDINSQLEAIEIAYQNDKTEIQNAAEGERQQAVSDSVAFQEMVFQESIGNIASTLGALSSLFAENFEASKALAKAEALINTYQAISAALKAPTLAQRITGVAFASAQGFGAVRNIDAQQKPPTPSFSVGTRAAHGILTGSSHAMGGVPILAEGGEAVINKRSTAMFKPVLSAMNEAGGGVRFQNGGIPSTSGLDSTGSILSAIRGIGQQQMFVSVEEVNRVNNNLDVIETQSTI